MQRSQCPRQYAAIHFVSSFPSSKKRFIGHTGYHLQGLPAVFVYFSMISSVTSVVFPAPARERKEQCYKK
ncbi:MAG TPA: hypothetical protein ENN63_10120 [Bacteroidetes bacterium]|nr:hypothetical protein [Bacteroidota bacterium]